MPEPVLDPGPPPRYRTAIGHVLEPALERLRADGDTVGYRIGDEAVTFERVGRGAVATAGLLRARGVRPGEPVGLVAEPGLPWLGAAVGVMAAGAALAPLNHRLTRSELAGLVAAAGMGTVLAGPGCPLPAGPELAAIPPPAAAAGALELEGGGEDLAVVLHTSGSTGRPKGVLLTHDNLVQGVLSFLDVFGCTGRDRTCVAVPLFHVTGLVDQFLHMLWLGGMCRLLREFRTEDLLASLVRDEVTVMISVPSVFALLVRRPPSEPLSLRLAIYGGAPVSLPTVRGLLDLVPGIQPRQGYGMTEITSMATMLPPDRILDAPNSVGVPTPITELRVVDGEGAEVPAGALGEILLRGPHRSPGYLGQPEETAEAIDPEGWLHTGDVAWREQDGLLYLAGRMTEMINRGGEKISPREIEVALAGHPSVREVVAFGLPDEVLHEVPAAAVVVEEDAPVSEADLAGFLEERLAEFKRPTAILRLPELPLAPTGKPDLAVLRSRAGEARSR